MDGRRARPPTNEEAFMTSKNPPLHWVVLAARLRTHSRIYVSDANIENWWSSDDCS